MFWHKIPVLVAKAGDVQASRHKYQIFVAMNMDGNCPNPMVWRLQMLKQFASFLAGDSTTISSTDWYEVQVLIMSCECDMTHFFFLHGQKCLPTTFYPGDMAGFGEGWAKIMFWLSWWKMCRRLIKNIQRVKQRCASTVLTTSWHESWLISTWGHLTHTLSKSWYDVRDEYKFEMYQRKFYSVDWAERAHAHSAVFKYLNSTCIFTTDKLLNEQIRDGKEKHHT